jgi:hypothetical protein
MFNPDFYPTPDETADLMQLDIFGKIVLEPSAGSGNLIEYIRRSGAKEVLACEKDERLANITKAKCDQFLCSDFLSVVPEQVSHIDQIIMNPPFSSAATHILHAYEIAPEGCEITALANWDSISSYTTGNYRTLEKLVKDFGWMQNLGQTFRTAERTTNVNIGLIKLYKPVVSDQSKFEGFYMEDDESAGDYGLMGFSEVQRVVGLYRGALESVEAVFEAGKKLNQYTREFSVGNVEIKMERGDNAVNKKQFAVALQKKAWKDLINKLNLEKYVTSQVMKDINTFCERQHNIPFTVKNIRKMFEILVGTKEETFKRSLVEAIDNFTKYTHENRYELPGWKTNKGHLLGKKIIVDNIVQLSYTRGLSLAYNDRYKKLNDLQKVLCNMTGTNFDEIKDLWMFFQDGGQQVKNAPDWDIASNYESGSVVNYNGRTYFALTDTNKHGENPKNSRNWAKPVIERGQWYRWGFFEFKCFKKGTMHLKFNDEKDWEQLNRKYAEIKGQVLPEKL